MTTLRTALRFTLAVGLLAGCGDPTEIFVVVDSDLAPSEIEAVTVFATGPGGLTLSASGNVTAEPLPRTVGLVHEDGALGPLFVRAQGSRGGSLVVERSARLSFVEGKIVVLPLRLLSRCAGVSCSDGDTCDESGSCNSDGVDEDGLAEWDGTIPRLDGGVATGDTAPPDSTPTCTPTAESCNDRDDDCDGLVDESFDLTSDIENCGSCGNRCRGGRAACCAGICGRDGCP